MINTKLWHLATVPLSQSQAHYELLPTMPFSLVHFITTETGVQSYCSVIQSFSTKMIIVCVCVRITSSILITFSDHIKQRGWPTSSIWAEIFEVTVAWLANMWSQKGQIACSLFQSLVGELISHKMHIWQWQRRTPWKIPAHYKLTHWIRMIYNKRAKKLAKWL